MFLPRTLEYLFIYSQYFQQNLFFSYRITFLFLFKPPFFSQSPAKNYMTLVLSCSFFDKANSKSRFLLASGVLQQQSKHSGHHKNSSLSYANIFLLKIPHFQLYLQPSVKQRPRTLFYVAMLRFCKWILISSSNLLDF